MESSAKRSICSLKKLNRLGKSIVALFLCIVLVLGYSYRCPVQVHAAAGFWETEVDVLVAGILNGMGIRPSGDVSSEQYAQMVDSIGKQAQAAADAIGQKGLFQAIADAAKNGCYTVTQSAWNDVANAWGNYQHQVDLRAGFGYNTYHAEAFTDISAVMNYFGMGDGCSWGNDWSDTFAKQCTEWQGISSVEVCGGDFKVKTSSTYTLNKSLCGDSKANLSLIIDDVTWHDKIWLQNSDTFTNNLWFQGSTVTKTQVKAFCKGIRYNDITRYSVHFGDRINVLKCHNNTDNHDYLLFWLPEIRNDYDTDKYWDYYQLDATANGINISDSGMTFGQNELVDRKNLVADGYSVLCGYDPEWVFDKIKARQTAGGIDTSKGIQVKVGTDAKSPADVRARTQAQTTGLEKTAEAEAADEAANAGKSTVPASASDLPDFRLPADGLQKKFPFCLPWDLVACYKLFQVPAKAPVWSIPVNIDQGLIHLHQTYTYDMNSNGIMDKILPVFKWFLNIAVVLGLIAITRKIMS